MELWPLSPPARSIRCRFESMGFHPGGWAGTAPLRYTWMSGDGKVDGSMGLGSMGDFTSL